MVLLLSHFPGKKLLLVGSIFILHDILRIPFVTNISHWVTFSFNMWKSRFRGLQNYSDKPFSGAGPMPLTSARRSVFKIKTNVRVSMGLTHRRKTAKTLVDSRKNWQFLTVSRK